MDGKMDLKELKRQIFNTIENHVPKEIIDAKENIHVDPELIIEDVKYVFENFILKTEMDLLEILNKIRNELKERIETFNLSKEDYYGIMQLALFHKALKLISSAELYDEFIQSIPIPLMEDFEIITKDLEL